MSPVKVSDETKTTSNVLFSSATEYRHYSWEVFTTTTCGLLMVGKTRLPNSVRIQLQTYRQIMILNWVCMPSRFLVQFSFSRFLGCICTFPVTFKRVANYRTGPKKIVTYHQCQITVFSGELSITSFCETGILTQYLCGFYSVLMSIFYGP